MPTSTVTPKMALQIASTLFSKRFTRKEWNAHPDRPVSGSSIIVWFGSWNAFLDQVEFSTTRRDEVSVWARNTFTTRPTRNQWDDHPLRPVHSDTIQKWMGWNVFVDNLWGSTRLSARASDEEVKIWMEKNTDRNDTGCWLMRTTPSSSGYGRLTRNYVPKGAHQVSYELFHGPMPSGHVVRHTCDTPMCCNPDHLISGTRSENALDYITNGGRLWDTTSKLGTKRPHNQTPTEIIEWWHSRVTKTDDGCWLHPHAHKTTGYVVTRINGVNWQAHRFIRCHLDGLPKNHPLIVRHTCHNRACLNPDHLVWGTIRENRLDDLSQGKNQKLTPAIRSSILGEWNCWGGTKTDFDRYMATKYHVSTGAIRNIRIASA